jgi:hypothetical protein
MSNTGLIHITRVDAPKKQMHGYLVRVRWKGKPHQRWFSDAQHDGPAGALMEAFTWRNTTWDDVGRPRTNRRVVGPTRRVGVRRTTKNGSPVFSVTWSPEPGKVGRTTVSIAKFGEETARQLARQIRRAKRA